MLFAQLQYYVDIVYSCVLRRLWRNWRWSEALRTTGNSSTRVQTEALSDMLPNTQTHPLMKIPFTSNFDLSLTLTLAETWLGAAYYACWLKILLLFCLFTLHSNLYAWIWIKMSNMCACSAETDTMLIISAVQSEHLTHLLYFTRMQITCMMYNL